MPAKLVFSGPGVLIVRFVGFRRPVFKGPLKGDVGVEKFGDLSKPGEVTGRGADATFMFRERFLTFRGLLPASSVVC